MPLKQEYSNSHGTQDVSSDRKIGATLAKTQRQRWLRSLALFASVIILGGCIYHAKTLWRITQMKSANPETTALIENRAKESRALGQDVKREQVWVSLSEISPNVLQCLVAAEDPNFYTHRGVDWKATKKAMESNWEQGGLIIGGSTITQQLAKNLFLSTSKSPLRKLHEYLLAFELEQFLGKDRILEIYLNVVEWGEGIYGIEAASQHYFQIPSRALTIEQAAFLVAILPGPREHTNPAVNPDRVNYRASLILRLMRLLEDVSEETLRARATHKVMPDFPPELKTSGVRGPAVAEIDVGRNGELLKVEVTEAPAEQIKETVKEAVEQWKFGPSEKGILHMRGKLMFLYVNENGKQYVRDASQPQSSPPQ